MNGYDEDAAAILRSRADRDVATVRRGVLVAERAHRGSYPRSGDPQITHVVAVARLLGERSADASTVVAAILHDLVDGGLVAEFGSEVSALLAHFAVIDPAHPFDPPPEADPRALTIKVACRLHNMRTIRFVAPDSGRREAEQTRHEIAPLARALGMHDIGAELDSLASAALRPSPLHERPTRTPSGTALRIAAAYPLWPS